jgi:hypothetical protein
MDHWKATCHQQNASKFSYLWESLSIARNYCHRGLYLLMLKRRSVQTNNSNGWTWKTFINILATRLLYITRIATRSTIDLSVLNSRTVVLAFVYFVSLFTYSKSLCMCRYISLRLVYCLGLLFVQKQTSQQDEHFPHIYALMELNEELCGSVRSYSLTLQQGVTSTA